MKGLVIGVVATSGDAGEALARIELLEQVGVDVAWLASGPIAPDPLAVFCAAALRTGHVRFGTCILPTFPRHPLATAQSAYAVDALAPGRLRLGLGPSHRPMVEPTYGIPFERPLEHLREYLTILRSAFATGRVDFEGKRLTAKTQFPKPANVELLIAALRPNAFRLAGELTDGAIPWVAPLPYLRDVALPAIRDGAAVAGRAAPRVIAHIPVIVSEDEDAVRSAAQRALALYPRLPFYSRMFQDAGFPEAADGVLSDRMIDSILVSGSAAAVKERLREVTSFGIDEILVGPINLSGDHGSWERTARAVGELAAES
jgi:F420-dependent oxidoreductase-like protein